MVRNGVRDHKQGELELKLETQNTHTPSPIDYYGKSEGAKTGAGRNVIWYPTSGGAREIGIYPR
jgi:hypothetical protein